MNLVICGIKDEHPAIRNWERQCGCCAHGKIVIRRDLLSDGKMSTHLSWFLYNCPHVQRKFKLIGKNTHRDRPNYETFLIPMNFFTPYMPSSIEAGLIWQEIPAQEGAKKTWVAEIPREILKREFGFKIPLAVKPCSVCQRQVIAPGTNAVIQP